MEGHDVRNTSIRTTMKKLKIHQSTPDSVAVNPVSGRSHSKETKIVHPVWTGYSIDLARFMAPLTSLPIIPTEIFGSLNRLASSTPNIRGKGRPARTTMKSLAHRTQGDRRNSPLR